MNLSDKETASHVRTVKKWVRVERASKYKDAKAGISLDLRPRKTSLFGA